jgi:hypothetical protein
VSRSIPAAANGWDRAGFCRIKYSYTVIRFAQVKMPAGPHAISLGLCAYPHIIIRNFTRIGKLSKTRDEFAGLHL